MAYWISSDLDGTLLDHHDYSFDGALAGLAVCEQQNIPIVLNTSKTLRETLNAQKKLGINGPIIIENGSALIFPNASQTTTAKETNAPIAFSHDPQRIIFGIKRNALIHFINATRRTYGWRFEGFNDWSIDEISEHTGLSKDEAEQAADKHFSEPFIWLDTDANLANFETLARQHGLRLLKGGRFYHLQGLCTKATPLDWLRRNLKLPPHQAKLIALGDSNNDAAMLEAADITVCIKSHNGSYPELSNHISTFQTKQIGPHGWSEAILTLTNKEGLH